MLYILLEGELFPLTLSLPTGSLRSFTNYVKSQLSRGRKLSQVVTKITLKKATNASGIAFSQAVFSFVRMLNADECTAVADVTETVKAYAANLTTAKSPAAWCYQPMSAEVRLSCLHFTRTVGDVFLRQFL